MSLTRMYSSRMRTARLLTGVCLQGWADPPGCGPPSHVTCDACWEAKPPHLYILDSVSFPGEFLAGHFSDEDSGTLNPREYRNQFAPLYDFVCFLATSNCRVLFGNKSLSIVLLQYN